MGKQIIATDNAPGAIGPYSQGINTGSLIFTSGQLPINNATGEHITDCIKKATEQSLKNVKEIVEAAGSSMDKVIKVTVYLKDLKDFDAVNTVYATFFREDCPARSCIEVARLPKDALIEIEAIALA